MLSFNLHALDLSHLQPQKSTQYQQQQQPQQQQSQEPQRDSSSDDNANEIDATVTSSDDYDNHPQYSFSYDVQDTSTGDEKQQEEQRDGDVVQGQVSRKKIE